nr:hypothetical protein CFP56_56757 [Quercus suber]
MEDAIDFLDLGLDAMVWLGFMAGGGSSRSEVREGEWGFGCENQRNHQEEEWESSLRYRMKKYCKSLIREFKLIRDSRGQCLGGFAKAFVVTSSLPTELWALREGLLLYIEMRAQAVVVELDAIAAVSLLYNACTNGDFSILVDDCRDMLLQLPQVQILHCFREANCCVDALARMGSASCDVEIFL